MDKSTTFLLLLGLFALTSFMTGLIWFVQIVHYPIFLRVPPQAFVEFQSTHMRTTGNVVMLPMLAEMGISLGLLVLLGGGGSWQGYLNYVSFGLLVIVWLVTFLVSVPLHESLVHGGYDAGLIWRLVLTNWIRTLAWSGRCLLIGYWIYLEAMSK